MNFKKKFEKDFKSEFSKTTFDVSKLEDNVPVEEQPKPKPYKTPSKAWIAIPVCAAVIGLIVLPAIFIINGIPMGTQNPKAGSMTGKTSKTSRATTTQTPAQYSYSDGETISIGGSQAGWPSEDSSSDSSSDSYVTGSEGDSSSVDEPPIE